MTLWRTNLKSIFWLYTSCVCNSLAWEIPYRARSRALMAHFDKNAPSYNDKLGQTKYIVSDSRKYLRKIWLSQKYLWHCTKILWHHFSCQKYSNTSTSFEWNRLDSRIICTPPALVNGNTLKVFLQFLPQLVNTCRPISHMHAGELLVKLYRHCISIFDSWNALL